MNQYRLWHRLRGHHIRRGVFDPVMLAETFRSRGWDDAKVADALIMAALHINEQCSCGDIWTFSPLTFATTYNPVTPR